MVEDILQFLSHFDPGVALVNENYQLTSPLARAYRYHYVCENIKTIPNGSRAIPIFII